MGNGQRFAALYVRDFRLFWFGQIISLSGTWMHSVAQSWLVYSLTKSPLYLGIIASLSSLPILLFTLIGGTIADRYPKRNILLITQVLSLLFAFVLGVLTDKGMITVWQIGLVSFFLGTVNAFDVPTRQSFLAEVVDRKEITNAIALNSAAFNGARIIGPTIAGFLISSVGMAACFYVNGLSFIPAIIALLMIRCRTISKDSGGSLLNDVADGLRFVKSDASVFSIMILIALFSLFGIPYITLLPIIAGEVLDVGAKGLSFLMASAGAGSFGAAITLAFRGEVRQHAFLLPSAGMIFSLGLLALSFSKHFYLSLLIMFFVGWGATGFLAMGNSYIQGEVPNALRGRVMSLYTLVFLGFAPIGNSLIGFAAELLGTITALIIFSAICVVGTLMFWRTFSVKGQGALS